MIYAERKLDDGFLEKGAFLSLAEFLTYREQGWSSTSDINERADAVLKAQLDPVMVEKSLQAAREGNGTTIDEILDET